MRANVRLITMVAMWVAALVIPLSHAGCDGKSPEVCDSGEDEDQDGRVDCGDEDCWVLGGVCPEVCATVFDEDGDGFSGCKDTDCWVPGGACEEACDTEDDEDADGTVGCLDSDCWFIDGPCDEDCTSDDDEDADGNVACLDDDCWIAGGVCTEVCTGGNDEDGDGDFDCGDADCDLDPACIPTFAVDVQPIFFTYCSGTAGNCHTDATPLGGLSFDSYDDIPLPSLYCPGESKGWCSLFRILEPSMPEDCLNCLADEDVATIQKWVDAGLPP